MKHPRPDPRLHHPGPDLDHLADFVNRRLVTSADPAAATGIKGALQTALDPLEPGTASDGRARANAGVGNNVFGNTRTRAEGSKSPTEDNLHRLPNVIAGFPGWLLQGDLLQPLAPQLSARSDTFVIRTYGETLDPVNSTPAVPVVIGRAWCEAVVQRVPEFIETADDADTLVTDLASDNNRTFGRRFKVVSFRWLAPEDI